MQRKKERERESREKDRETERNRHTERDITHFVLSTMVLSSSNPPSCINLDNDQFSFRML
jgi:hypothetical protein